MEETFDDFKNCRVCGKVLTLEEKEAHIKAQLPATCTEHLIYIKQQLEICAPLFAQMNLS